MLNTCYLHENITFPSGNLPMKSAMSVIEKMRLDYKVIWNKRGERTMVSIPDDYRRPTFKTNRGNDLFYEALKNMHDVPIPRKKLVR